MARLLEQSGGQIFHALFLQCNSEQVDQTLFQRSVPGGYRRGHCWSIHGSIGEEQSVGEVPKKCVQPAQAPLRDRSGIRFDARESSSTESTPPSCGSASKLPVFSLEQTTAIIANAAPFYRAALDTLAMTGLRAGELLALRWKDCDFINRRFTIANTVWRGKLQTTKTESSDRTIGMPEPLFRTLTEQRTESKFTDASDFVFAQADGKPIDPDSLRRLGIYPALEKAGIPFQKRASGCHAFRRFVASVIHKQTGSLKLAQKQLGQSTLATTAHIYTSVDEAQVTETAATVGKAFCGRSVVETVQSRNSVN